MNYIMQTVGRGQVGVYRVLAELILRRHVPYLPVVDEGVDVILGSGVKIQVKTTLRETRHWRTPGAWLFQLAAAQRIVKRAYVTKPARQFSKQVDFVILHAIEANRYWIVPAAVLDGRHTVSFTDGHKQWKDCDIVEAKRLRANGHSYQQIADMLGADRNTVIRRIKGRQKRTYTDIAQYENRWDLISGAVATLTEAITIAETPRTAVADREALLKP